MARRKKEPAAVHRERIASIAEQLFMKNGIPATTMNDIAGEAGYSKATLYVYFENKEAIVGFLVLKSMKKLYLYISDAVDAGGSTKERYNHVCQSLWKYYQEFPFYFRLVLDKINVNFDNENFLSEEQETYAVGEKINAKLIQFLEEGIRAGDIRKDIDIFSTIFALWGMLSGFIGLAEQKEEYLKKAAGITKQEFLSYGFEMLYRSVGIEGEGE